MITKRKDVASRPVPRRVRFRELIIPMVACMFVSHISFFISNTMLKPGWGAWWKEGELILRGAPETEPQMNAVMELATIPYRVEPQGLMDTHLTVWYIRRRDLKLAQKRLARHGYASHAVRDAIVEVRLDGLERVNWGIAFDSTMKKLGIPRYAVVRSRLRAFMYLDRAVLPEGDVRAELEKSGFRVRELIVHPCKSWEDAERMLDQ